MENTQKLKAQLVIVTGFLILYLIFKSDYLLYIAAFSGILFVFFPAMGNFIVKGWFWLSGILGWLNSRILLSLVFYLFLFPVASLMKVFSSNLLRLKNRGDSLFDLRNHKYLPKDLENTW